MIKAMLPPWGQVLLPLKTTVPVGIAEPEPFTFAVSVNGEFCANFVLAVEMLVVVGVGLLPPPPPPPPLLPPPQPMAKVRTPSAATPNDRRSHRRRCGRSNIVRDSESKNADRDHQPAGPIGASGLFNRIGRRCALELLEGAVVAMDRVAVADAPLVRVTDAGEKLHVSPAKPDEQLSATVLV